MTAEKLKERFCLTAHPENGSYAECHYPCSSDSRAMSGSIYYYVAPGELTKFHVIDCDEYWCYTAGSALDVWLIDEAGTVSVKKLGTEPGCEPLIYVKKGVIFASKHVGKVNDGTFLSCITVPRFSPEGFKMLSDEYIAANYPETKDFFSEVQ